MANLPRSVRNPFAPQFFGDGGGGARTAEEVGDEVAFVGGGFDDAFKEGFGFLGGVVFHDAHVDGYAVLKWVIPIRLSAGVSPFSTLPLR